MFTTTTDLYSRDEVNAVLAQIDGARVLGTLDTDLITTYCHLVSVEQELEDVGADYRKRFLEQVAKQMLEFSVTDADAFNNSMSRLVVENVITDAEASDFMKLQSEYLQLFHRFWHEARTSFGNWLDFLEVRKDFQLVVIGKKFQ